mgnify:CR=1 FL=1
MLLSGLAGLDLKRVNSLFKRRSIYKNRFTCSGSKDSVVRDLRSIIQLIAGLDADEVKIKLEVEAFKAKRKRK